MLSKIKDCLKFHETLHLFAFSAPERPCGFPTRLNVSHSSLLHLIISFSLHLSSHTNLLQSEEITYLFRENLKINNGESEWSIIIINLVVYAFYNVHKGKRVHESKTVHECKSFFKGKNVHGEKMLKIFTNVRVTHEVSEQVRFLLKKYS